MLQSNQITNNLIKARELIADKKKWWGGTVGENCSHPLPKNCAITALYKTLGLLTNNRGVPQEIRLLQKACHLLYDTSDIAGVNDSRGHLAIMRVYDKAIEFSLK